MMALLSPPVPINEFINCVRLCAESTIFAFNDEAYKQNFGAAMGSPLSPVLANLCMELLESEYLPLVPDHLRPLFWVRYVDDRLMIYQKDR